MQACAWPRKQTKAREKKIKLDSGGNSNDHRVSTCAIKCVHAKRKDIELVDFFRVMLFRQWSYVASFHLQCASTAFAVCCMTVFVFLRFFVRSVSLYILCSFDFFRHSTNEVAIHENCVRFPIHLFQCISCTLHVCLPPLAEKEKNLYSLTWFWSTAQPEWESERECEAKRNQAYCECLFLLSRRQLNTLTHTHNHWRCWLLNTLQTKPALKKKSKSLNLAFKLLLFCTFPSTLAKF